MQEQFLFEYAIIRVVPRVEREEFINIGVILYAELELHLLALEKICEGGKNGGPIGMLDVPSRFRWLTATRSTIVQTSKVHPGFCIDAQHCLDKLYRTMVL
jgi:hypothetical protein